MDWCNNGPCVFPSSVLAEILASAVAVDGEFDAAKVHLYTNNIVPAPNTVLADLTPATFTGATPAAITWGTVFSDNEGNAIAPGGSHLFPVTGTISETVYGYFITDTAGTKLLAIRQLPAAQQAVPGGPPVMVYVELKMLNTTGVPVLA